MDKHFEKATFAAGCFWHVEEAFCHLTGVISTMVGYTGGHFNDPTYEDVCSDTTGHAEAVEITFDPEKISYERLLDVFFENHNPTTRNRQGLDVGSQYRSAIFYHDENQKFAATKKIEALQEHLSKPIATELTPAKTFYPAEEYHQKYLQKHNRSSCNPY